MSRFFAPPENIKENRIFIDGDEARHILTVMRLGEGDAVVVFDGTGNQYQGFIDSVDKRKKILIVEIIKTEKPLIGNIPEVTLAQAMPKKDKMEYILEKATELGVSRIIPVITRRTIARPDTLAFSRKLSRWEKIATSAAKQCGRISIPRISDIKRFKDIIDISEKYDLSVFAVLNDKTRPMKEVLKEINPRKILVFIGPEGGFAPDEISMCADNFKFVSLGYNVLKSDTAGLFALSVINYEYS
jgi:16S rRNA (uracil1498-N3)-methyltransferase